VFWENTYPPSDTDGALRVVLRVELYNYQVIFQSLEQAVGKKALQIVSKYHGVELYRQEFAARVLLYIYLQSPYLAI
jgi:hypothetical protein